MNVHMRARLTGCCADIDSDVVAVRREHRLYVTLRLAKQLKNSDLLFGRHVVEARNVALGYDEDVTTAQRMVVVAHICQSILQDNISQNAQLARR
jgi:hypothetical protein